MSGSLSPVENVFDLVRRRKAFIEVSADTSRGSLGDLHPRKENQDHYEIAEFLGRIGKPSVDQLLAERFLLNEQFYKAHKPDQMAAVEKAKEELHPDTKAIVDRYDAIRTNPENIKTLGSWAKKELAIHGGINRKIYDVKMSGGKPTSFGTYYETMFFASLLIQEVDFLKETAEQTKSTRTRFDDTIEATTSPRSVSTDQLKDNFLSNFLLLAALASIIESEVSVHEQQADIINNWGTNQDLGQQGQTPEPQDNWRENESDTTLQNESLSSPQEDSYQQEDRTDNQPDTGSTYEAPSFD